MLGARRLGVYDAGTGTVDERCAHEGEGRQSKARGYEGSRIDGCSWMVVDLL
jgi:hypothetical protein